MDQSHFGEPLNPSSKYDILDSTLEISATAKFTRLYVENVVKIGFHYYKLIYNFQED